MTGEVEMGGSERKEEVLGGGGEVLKKNVKQKGIRRSEGCRS